MGCDCLRKVYPTISDTDVMHRTIPEKIVIRFSKLFANVRRRVLSQMNTVMKGFPVINFENLSFLIPANIKI